MCWLQLRFLHSCSSLQQNHMTGERERERETDRDVEEKIYRGRPIWRKRMKSKERERERERKNTAKSSLSA